MVSNRRFSGKRCYLCGRSATTRDHVPPESFYTKPLPSNLITVPACSHCNGRIYSPLDDRMRFYLAAAEGVNDAAKRILNEKVFSENSKKRREYKVVSQTFHQVQSPNFVLQRSGGSPIGKDALVISANDLKSFSLRVLRGIVAYSCPKIYRFDGGASVQCLPESGRPLEADLKIRSSALDVMSRCPPKVIGDGVFKYSVYSEEAWAFAYFQFYEAIDFFGMYINGAVRKFT